MAFSNIANFLKGFAREFYLIAKVMRKIAINLESEKRNASPSLPVRERQNIWFNLITKCFSYYPRKLSSFTY